MPITTLEVPSVHARVAHHFDSPQQQFDAGKLGMWLFLVTEVLFFSGLFVAYAVYRANHPQVFADAHHYLNTSLGALNTLVLLLSSLTMAWAVRCAQLGESQRLVSLLTATLACASFFLGVKAVEYAHKWTAGLLWAGAYVEPMPEQAMPHGNGLTPLVVLSLPAAMALVFSAGGWVVARSVAAQRAAAQRRESFWLRLAVVAATFFVGLACGVAVEAVTADHADTPMANEQTDSSSQPAELVPSDVQLTGVFFSIYYLMTGVHAIHILAGMGVMTWLLARALRGEFGPQSFAPVDYTGLYWHLVDLVWIYLFPLLYLIR
jgi:cytochrome c oxidase subunit 3